MGRNELLIEYLFVLPMSRQWCWWSILTVSNGWVFAHTGQFEHSMILVCLLNRCWVNTNDTAFSFLFSPSLSLSLSLWDFCVIFLLLISLHHYLRAVFIKVLKYNALRSCLQWITQALLVCLTLLTLSIFLSSLPHVFFVVVVVYVVVFLYHAEDRAVLDSFICCAFLAPARQTTEKICQRL